MQIGMIGIGKMGANMARRLMKHGHQCVVYARSQDTVAAMVKEGATGSSSMEDLVKKLAAPKTVWLMVPAGEATENAVVQLAALLPAGSTMIDGGNSFFQDDVRRAKMLQPKGINYLDVGTSGGVWGVERGYCLMIGGDSATVKRLQPIFTSLAPGQGGIPPLARTGVLPKHRRTGLSALRTRRGRAFRQNGPQRHRIRHHAGLRGRI